ncbi:unnamed protein product [Effrenium voratum]|nr:unnamed protein product [Effrenium voratum]
MPARDYRIFGDYIASNEEFLHLPVKRYTYVLPDGAKVTSRDFLYPLDDIYCLVNGWYDLPRDKAANDREYVERMSRKTCQQLQAEVPNFENLSFQDLLVNFEDSDYLQKMFWNNESSGLVPEWIVKQMRRHAAVKCLLNGGTKEEPGGTGAMCDISNCAVRACKDERGFLQYGSDCPV